MFRQIALFVLFINLFFCVFSLPGRSETFSASHIPWSGYWWPLASGGLVTGAGYYGSPAPLEKYDLLEMSYYPADLSRWYRDYYYDPDAPDWYGHCGSWALAAAVEHMEIMPSVEDNIVFRVGDKKGLLTLCHERDLVELGDGRKPEEFHYWLLNYIQDQGLAFVADLDPGEEQWNYPIYQVDMQSSKSGNFENITAIISYATDNVHPDYMGTKSITKTYTYTLQLDANDNIVGGSWTGDSITDHPDRMMFPQLVQPVSDDLDYNEVLRLAGARDDELENGSQVVSIAPGKYNLTLLDDDLYQIVCGQGDRFQVRVEKIAGSGIALNASLIDGSGLEVEQTVLESSGSVSWLVEAVNPPYILHLSQSDYGDPNIYSLLVDLETEWTYHFPFLPKNGMWSGFVLTNATGATIDQVMLTTNDSSGLPLHTVAGPMNLEAGEKQVLLFANLPWRPHEHNITSGLTLRAGDELEILNLFGSTTQVVSQVQKNPGDSLLIFPETVPELDPQKSLVGTVLNESFADTGLGFRLFRENGQLASQPSISLGSREAFTIRPGGAPFYSMPDDGWLEVSSQAGTRLNGYYYLSSPDQAEGLFALTVDEETKVIPHIPPPGNWVTTVSLINPNDGENMVILHPVKAGGDLSRDLSITLGPYEKKSIELQDYFGFLPGDPLYHSIVQITGQLPFVGYYLYQSTSESDKAKFPLISTDHLTNKLTMPHYPGTAGYWWTGVGIFNPQIASQQVQAKPYDQQGQIIPGQSRYLQIEAGGYDIFTIKSLFGESASSISFVTFETANDNDEIGGFYLYGGNGAKMICGSVM